jgi:membrane protease YdiL (CAAX protease family)
VPGTPQYDAPYLLLAAQLIAASVLLAWLYGGSGESLLVVMLAHAAVNTWAGPLRVLPAATGSTRPLALATALLGAVALALVARGGAGRSWLALDPATD